MFLQARFVHAFLADVVVGTTTRKEINKQTRIYNLELKITVQQ